MALTISSKMGLVIWMAFFYVSIFGDGTEVNSADEHTENESSRIARIYNGLKVRLAPIGASDVIVVRHGDGTLRSTPLQVHLGPVGPIANGEGQSPKLKKGQRKRGKRVQIRLNSSPTQLTRFYIGADGIMRRRGNRQRSTVGLTRKDLGKLEPLMREGENELEFAVETNSSSRAVQCKLHLWPWTTKVALSDVDGTVTRSDLLGMLFASNWVQPGVRELYKEVHQMGHKFVFLSARPTSLGSLTRRFLAKFDLPPGALLLSPEPLGRAIMTSLSGPQKTKIPLLRRLQWAFGKSPFVAGFGNQKSDFLSYSALLLPTIFIVNMTGMVVPFELDPVGKKYRTMEKVSYQSMAENVQNWFAPI